MPKLLTSLAAAAVAVVLGVSTAHAAFTTDKCLAQKRKEQGKLHQQCRATGEAKALEGKPADLWKCTVKFQADPILERLSGLDRALRANSVAQEALRWLERAASPWATRPASGRFGV
jgi:hypothetical protein